MADISRGARAMAHNAAHGALFTFARGPDSIRAISGAADAVLEAAAPVIARDVLLSLAAELDKRATCSLDGHIVKEAFRFAAELARRRAGQDHAATGEAGLGEAEAGPPGEHTGRLSATGEAP